ncbi:hypothetical protein KSP39_PZI011871 [Platanthera zijinensis]|uniref:Uncharacterized protein n=1 Tax=Platanthera zijinensis TaxID=2320716 RepID=A0AAP0BG24_9ASPA
MTISCAHSPLAKMHGMVCLHFTFVMGSFPRPSLFVMGSFLRPSLHGDAFVHRAAFFLVEFTSIQTVVVNSCIFSYFKQPNEPQCLHFMYYLVYIKRMIILEKKSVLGFEMQVFEVHIGDENFKKGYIVQHLL